MLHYRKDEIKTTSSFLKTVGSFQRYIHIKTLHRIFILKRAMLMFQQRWNDESLLENLAILFQVYKLIG